MIITWYGQSCFKIQSGELSLVIDPFSKEIGLTPPRSRTDILLVSHSHFDHANIETIPEGYFLIDGPGEYEIKGTAINGFPAFHDSQQGKELGLTAVYAIEIEGIKICHLGDFGEEKISPELLEKIGEVDILMVPVGGKFTLDAEAAANAVSRIEPKIVIPMHYHIPGLKVKLNGVDEFLKEMGAGKKTPQEKLTIKKKDLEGKETEVVVLKIA